MHYIINQNGLLSLEFDSLFSFIPRKCFSIFPLSEIECVRGVSSWSCQLSMYQLFLLLSTECCFYHPFSHIRHWLVGDLLVRIFVVPAVDCILCPSIGVCTVCSFSLREMILCVSGTERETTVTLHVELFRHSGHSFSLFAGDMNLPLEIHQYDWFGESPKSLVFCR